MDVGNTAVQQLMLFVLVGAEDRLFVPDLDFNPLNLSDIGWERVMPSKPTNLLTRLRAQLQSTFLTPSSHRGRRLRLHPKRARRHPA